MTQKELVVPRRPPGYDIPVVVDVTVTVTYKTKRIVHLNTRQLNAVTADIDRDGQTAGYDAKKRLRKRLPKRRGEHVEITAIRFRNAQGKSEQYNIPED
jgi:hypothetical protein